MPSTQAYQICEQLLYHFYENLLTNAYSLQSLFYQERRIYFLIPDAERRYFRTHEGADIAVPIRKFILDKARRAEILAWSYQVLADGLSIYTYIQYLDIGGETCLVTADSFYLVRLPGPGSYAIKGFTCQIIK